MKHLVLVSCGLASAACIGMVLAAITSPTPSAPSAPTAGDFANATSLSSAETPWRRTPDRQLGEELTPPKPELPTELLSGTRQAAARAAMELADTATASQVNAILDHLASDALTDRTRLLCLYVLARSQARFDHAERDALLFNEGLEWLAATAQNSENPGTAILTLGALGTESSSSILVKLGTDIDDPASADALMSLARFPSEANLAALEVLVVHDESDANRLQALRALLASLALSDEPDASTANILAFLRTDGATIASHIEQDAGIASLRHEARLLQYEIANL